MECPPQAVKKMLARGGGRLTSQGLLCGPGPFQNPVALRLWTALAGACPAFLPAAFLSPCDWPAQIMAWP